MKVSTGAAGASPSRTLGSGRTDASARAQAAQPAAATGADALSVSGGAHFLAVARQHLAGLPDVRVDKVEAIRTQLEARTYKPDAAAVADGLVREHSAPPKG